MIAMRHMTRALVSVLLILVIHDAAAAEEASRFGWWPFGRKASQPAANAGASMAVAAAAAPDAAQPLGSVPTAGAAVTTSATMPTESSLPLTPHEPLPQYSPPDAPQRRWMIESPLANITWPRIHMPEVSLPKPRLPRPQLWPRQSQVDDTRNAWVGKSLDPERPTPLQAARTGARRVADSTRAAWHKTVDVLTPGEPAPDNSFLARSEPRPSLWKRLFTAEGQQPQGPRTVTEWMAQDRLDP